MNRKISPRYEFGPFCLDKAEQVLTCDGVPVSLMPKTFEVLLALVENNGHVVSKDELMRAVWPDTHVEEANLTQNIFVLRKALGEGRAGRRYIETIPRRGYRFIADVREVKDEAAAVPPSAGVAMAESQRAVNSIAVLPLTNASHDPDFEYLLAGITEGIINSHGQQHLLPVQGAGDGCS